jgi:hypothetical protein
MTSIKQRLSAPLYSLRRLVTIDAVSSLQIAVILATVLISLLIAEWRDPLQIVFAEEPASLSFEVAAQTCSPKCRTSRQRHPHLWQPSSRFSSDACCAGCLCLRSREL